MNIIKRNNEIVSFDSNRIVNAILKAMNSVGMNEETVAIEIAQKIKEQEKDFTVTEIEQQIIKELYLKNLDMVANAYLEYKTQKSYIRKRFEEKYNGVFLKREFMNQYKHKTDPFPTEIGKFVYYRTYSRPIPEENRREEWWETCFRVVEFNMGLQLDAMRKNKMIITEKTMTELQREAEKTYHLMYQLKLFPSGRSLWIGGTKSSYTYPLSNFNCSFVVIDELKKFSEMFFALMLGTGVGLSVQKQYVSLLPKVNSNIEITHKSYEQVPKWERKEYTEFKLLNNNAIEIEIGDSKYGWSKAIEFYFEIISSKQYKNIEYIFFNYNNVRPKGEILKTFGGRASGHENIKVMFEKIHRIFKEKQSENQESWQNIEAIDCLDIATIIAENVVSGGVRRSAEIILCDKDDEAVLNAKSNLYYQNEVGEWISNTKILNRALSNNTVMYQEKPTREELHEHFKKIKTSGEPAFANFKEMQKRRIDVQGANPCFEILLRDRGVCNLSEVNLMGFVKSDGTFIESEILEAQKYSAHIGYRMASIELELHEWNLVNKEDRLVGCSLTGVMDFKNATNISDEDFISLLKKLRTAAQEAAYEMADFLNMNRSKLVTCVKPSGTISQLPTVSSGVHYSHSPYYLRRIRVDSKDPIAQAMEKTGFKWYPEVGQTKEHHSTKVFEFPMKAPEGKTKYDVSAIEQLELYKIIMENYVDHNASNTIHVRENEWDQVEEWIYENWDFVVGITFLSLDDSFYQLMPYESITKEAYEEMQKNQPKFNLFSLKEFENFEEEFSLNDPECTSGACPIR